MAGEADNVRVALRIRPLISSEKDRGCQDVVYRTQGAPQVFVNRTEAFNFNYVFDANDTQERIYDTLVPELLDKLLNGFNATILAYGQTGSGKTHTMGTAYDGQLNNTPGVIPRSMCDIFERLQKLSTEKDFVVQCSFVELYQEQLYDLLSDKPREKSIVDIRENRNGIFMDHLTEKNVTSAHEAIDCWVGGSAKRAVGPHAMNEQSSRSHAILTLTFQLTKKDETRAVTTSKFQLVDLAGSERSKKTQATGDRFKEGVKINQGLLALGNVISALGSGQASGFVPYRASKLTRLLQDSLGGNSVTRMIACVSPADCNVAETLSTLRYADRAKKIKNKPIINQDPIKAELNRIRSENEQLRLEVFMLKGLGNKAMAASEQDGEVECRNKQQHLVTVIHDFNEAMLRAQLAEESEEKLKRHLEKIKLKIAEIAQSLEEEQASSSHKNNAYELVQELKLFADSFKCETERTTDHLELMSLPSNDVENYMDEKGTITELELQRLIKEQEEAFTSSQMDYKEKLRQMVRQLDRKEQLFKKANENLRQFNNLNNKIDKKHFEECERKIKALEAEKLDLIEKLKHMNDKASAKLAEENRKRLHQLELELTEMKDKFQKQTKLLKLTKRDEQKVKDLEQEIQAMKQFKVRLVREMRHESQKFRQYKLSSDRQLLQSRSKSRKLENELERQKALYTKQANVLKRRCEEAWGSNKRLKHALDCQNMALLQRQKAQLAKGASTSKAKSQQLVSWVERELEVIVAVIDAEHSLEQLMEDRAIINCRIGELQRPEPPIEGTAEFRELKAFEEELEMRNAQITDLQQNVCSITLETRIRTFYESVQTVSDARTVLKQLLQSISVMRREHSNRLQEQKDASTEESSMREDLKQRCIEMDKQLRLLKLQHEEALSERENDYEEKISALLGELHRSYQTEHEECRKTQQEQLDEVNALRYDLLADLRKDLDETKQKTREGGKESAVDGNNEQTFEIEMAGKETCDPEEEQTSGIEMDDSFDPEQHSSDPDLIETLVMHRLTVASSENASAEANMTQIDSANSVTESGYEHETEKDDFESCECAGSNRSLEKCDCVQCIAKCPCDSGKQEDLNELKDDTDGTSTI